MIRIGNISLGEPDSLEGTIELVEAFCYWFNCRYPGPNASSTFAHIVLGDYNLEDSFIHWCIEWEQVRSWLDDEMELIERECPITHTVEPTYTRIALREEALEKAQVIIRFMLDLTTIPEEHRIQWVNDD